MKLMNVMEPITSDNLSELRPGEWIWDNKRVRKPAHENHRIYEDITYTYEPIGFRQIHLLELPGMYSKYTSGSPFKLTDNSSEHAYRWVKFEENRFFKFKWNMLDQLGQKKGE